MAIDSPTTYGEYYWAAQLEAQKLFNDEVEAEVSGYVESMFDELGLSDFTPPSVNRFIRAMTSKKSFAWGSILARFGSEMADGVLAPLLGHATKDLGYEMAGMFSDLRITAEQASILNQRRKISEEFFNARMLSEGLKPAEAAAFYGSLIPYPSISDIMRWGRYHGEPTATRATVWEKFDVPAADYDMYEWLTLQVLTRDDIHGLFRRGILNEPDTDFLFERFGYRDPDVSHVKELGWSLPNPMLIVQGDLLAGKENDSIIERISKADIHPDYAQTYYDAILTKPASEDIIAYQLRQDPDLSGIEPELRKVGIHPDYFGVYKELAQVIPPVADIITMAVREAFTPAIARKFGQYEDFPAELEVWAGKKGLTREWSERYWAAHWSLPSPQQGFSMLHRGVIDQDELNMLLRAQDVMPFWRDKLTQIAFRPLTRVDVRRMYREGVLDESGVYEAYLDAGYAPDNAKKMTEFTVKQTLSTQSKFTSTDVIAAYTKRMIDRSEAGSLLRDLGIPYANVSYIISRADYKRSWDLTDDKIRGIKNLYKKGVYDENKARAKLLGLNLPSDEVNLLFEQWWFEKEGELAPTWTKAETLKFAGEGIITKGRAQIELQRMGYDDEHINVYIGTIQ